jgi:hypothetical protein
MLRPRCSHRIISVLGLVAHHVGNRTDVEHTLSLYMLAVIRGAAEGGSHAAARGWRAPFASEEEGGSERMSQHM